MEFEAAIDRFEGDIAVLLPVGGAGAGDRGARLLWPRALLPPGAREGAHVRVSVSLDPTATAAAGQRVRSLLDALAREPARRKDKDRGGGEK